MPTYRAGKGITRFEEESTHSNGFMVRICRDGTRVSEFFSDGKYGGTKKAKKAAETRYKELVEEWGPARERVTKDLLTQRNTSGHVGVHLSHTESKDYPGSEYYAYVASWVTEDGQRQKISFGFNRYGEDLSYKLACYAREKLIKDRSKVEAKFKSEIEAFEKKKKPAKKLETKVSKKAPKKAAKKAAKKRK